MPEIGDAWMTVANIGSINRDFFFKVPHARTADETIEAQNFQSSMNGKELKQSGAIAPAGGLVIHASAVGCVGAIGGDDPDAIRRLRSGAVDVFPTAKKLDNFTQRRPTTSGGV
ncbi:MAG: hypothetical protein ABJ246_07395 [Paracoccaceae bacterium]